MSAYKKRKLIAFAKHVGIHQREPIAIVDDMAVDVVCESPDINCPALRWCHANRTMPSNLGKFGVVKYCHEQLTEWWRA